MSSPAILVDQELASEEYYHGVLQREDMKTLLLKNGDFLLRTTAPKAIAAPYLVLSMMCNEKAMENGVKNYIVSQKDGQYLIEEKAFPSVSALIDHYLKTKESVVKGKEAVIACPVPRQPWEVNHEDLTLTKKKLGNGVFGPVSQGKLVVQGKTVDVAVKAIDLEALGKEQVKEMLEEARMMRRMEHPNVLKFYGVAVGSEPLMLILELAKNGALDWYLKRNKLPIEKLNEMVLQAAWGLEYIHSKNILHRDIAARNCLYADGVVKIADFRMAKEGETYEHKPEDRLAFRWAAPETISNGLFSQKTDVWALGVMAWEIYHNGQEPYPGMNGPEVVNQVPNGYRMQFQPAVHPHVTLFIINRVWAHNSAVRGAIHDVTSKFQEIFGVKRPAFSL